MGKQLRLWAGIPLAAIALTAPTAGTASAAIPVNKPMAGSMTYYTDAGHGACGTLIDASSETLVAVSHTWWTSANPKNDPLCRGVSVKVTYQGKTITVPVKDKCPSCDAGHMDLSQPAFGKLAPLGTGVINGITWQFVNADGKALGPAISGTAGSDRTGARSR
ncbi:cysteine/serine endopeptidase inhibitor [Saccharothrix sp. ST-888]|uniref:cysteine/serine endopeptidase inhibitor n=1 Tax=Saccharothrix sp. ST-888 TaxID=1427391 RepID=UPI0007C669B7|nr:cysteine/serine endopeptidase inhibitor [Saccharothrix sp. ST-888]